MKIPSETSSRTTKNFGPYSPIRAAGDFYFISGQVGVDGSSQKVSSNISDQTHQALYNLKTVLKTAGLSLNDVVKTTVFLTDMSNFAAVNEIYVKYFSDPRPARSAVGVKELPRVGGDIPIKIEIEAIAVRQGTS